MWQHPAAALANVAALQSADSATILRTTGCLFTFNRLARYAASVESRVRTRELLSQRHFSVLQTSLRAGAGGNVASLLTTRPPQRDSALVTGLGHSSALPIAPTGAANANVTLNEAAAPVAASNRPRRPRPVVAAALTSPEKAEKRKGENREDSANSKKKKRQRLGEAETSDEMRQRESCGEKEKRRERLSRRVWRTAKAAEVHQGVTTTNVHVVDGRASTTPERESERILEAAAVGPLVVLLH